MVFYQLNQLDGIGVTDDLCTGVLVDHREQIVDMIGDSSGSLEYADNFRLVVGDCDFTERSRTSANDNHGVACLDVLDLASHQAAAGVDDDVAATSPGIVPLDVFSQALRWRNSDR